MRGRIWKFELSEIVEWVRADGSDAHDGGTAKGGVR
jgi:hypothetical protein